ncbi:hypothetical protein, partial [Mycoplasmopsis bovis]|uniref:hypothetical protein n=1 Tax=Mycoplasmopsis bovis TaxID=28903 RepID=UPI003D270821
NYSSFLSIRSLVISYIKLRSNDFKSLILVSILFLSVFASALSSLIFWLLEFSNLNNELTFAINSLFAVFSIFIGSLAHHLLLC